MRLARSRTFAVVATIALVAGWLLLFRPAGLGGPATYVVVTGTSMEPTLHDGDFAVVTREDGYRRGDVITYRVPADAPGAGTLVIHRVVRGNGEGYITQGDNRDQLDDWRPEDSDVAGRLWFHIPAAGNLIRSVQQPALFGSLAGGVAAALVLTRPARRPDRQRLDAPDSETVHGDV